MTASLARLETIVVSWVSFLEDLSLHSGRFRFFKAKREIKDARGRKDLKETDTTATQALKT